MRPSKLTPEVSARILALVRGGNFRDVAAQAAGVGVRTLRRWCKQGRESKTGAYREFWHALLAAEGEAETLAVERVLAAAAQDPRHAQWWLERKFPERWGRDSHLAGELRRLVKQLRKREQAAPQADRRPSPRAFRPADDSPPPGGADTVA